jgi:hypothetical protein
MRTALILVWSVTIAAVTGSVSAQEIGAPTFDEIASRPNTSEFWLRALFQSRHRNMPDFRFIRRETDDLVAYLSSLKPR